MLVFRRQKGESFFIGDDIEVRILDITRGSAKVGVVAPAAVPIRRTEIADLNRRALVRDWASTEAKSRLKRIAERLKSPS